MANREWHKLQCYVYRDGNYAHAKNPLHEKLNAPLSEKLKQIRKYNGWSMQEFADRAGISLYAMRNLMSGRIFPLIIHLHYFSLMTGTKLEEWQALCIDGERGQKGGMICHPDYFITYAGGHLNMVERHKP